MINYSNILPDVYKETEELLAELSSYDDETISAYERVMASLDKSVSDAMLTGSNGDYRTSRNHLIAVISNTILALTVGDKLFKQK